MKTHIAEMTVSTKKGPYPPAEVREWVEARKGFRVPTYAPGSFDEFANSKIAACWGNNGGHRVGGYLVAVCQPSPKSKGSATPIWYDYIQAS